MAIVLNKITATEAVVQHLKQRIRACEFGPGEKLPSEQDLLGQYDVSRLTLREALAKLAAWGVITVRHGKGAYVSEQVSAEALDNVLIPMFPDLDAGRMNDLVEARNMIESEIAAMVARTRTDADLKSLEALLSFDADRITSAEVFAERDYAFHLALAQSAGNTFILSMYQALHCQIRSFLIQYARSIEDWEKALLRHAPILEAIAARDVDTARRLARDHAAVCASFICKGVSGSKEGALPGASA